MKKTRLILCIALVALMLVVLASFEVSAAITPERTFAGGSGTAGDPYVIKTEGQLAYFANQVNGGNSFSNKYIVLGANIVWNSGSLDNWRDTSPANMWVPIGTSSSPFKGNFDGNGYTVSGIYYKGDSSNVGFFGFVTDATVKGLNIENSFFDAYKNVGSVIGRATGSLTLSDCSSNAYVVSNDPTPENHDVGGIAGAVGGTSYAVNIYNCAFTGNITSDNGCNIGGIVGQMSGSPAKIWSCLATGTYTGYNRVAGILGRTYSDIEIYDCYSDCELYAWGTANLGGILGGSRVRDNTIYIHDCYYAGDFYVMHSTHYGSVKNVPTRLGNNEVDTDGVTVFGTFSTGSAYYTDSKNDNSYSASGNMIALPKEVVCLGGLDEFLEASDTFELDMYGNAYIVGAVGNHNHSDYFGKWIDDTSGSGQMRECLYGACTEIERRGLSINVVGVSVRYDSPSGIRFLTEVDKNDFFKSYYSDEKYKYSGADITFGTLLIPADDLDGELTVNTANAVNIEARVILSQNSDKLSYTAVLYGFPETIDAYKGALTVRSYAKYNDGTKTVYEYSSPVKCSYLDAALKVYEDERTSADVKEGLNMLIALGLVDKDFRDESAHRVAILEEATPELFDKYAEALAAQGFTKHTNYEYSDNLFGVYYNDECVVSFYYTPKSIGEYVEPNQEWYAYGSVVNERTEDMAKIQEKFGVTAEDAYNVMRIIVEERDEVDLPITSEENVYTRVSGMKNTITQFFPNHNYSHYGMGYAIQLADGSFIIIDGGENIDDPRNTSTDTDSDILYNYLMSAKPASHEKPIIAAWFLTHRHNDHVDLFYRGFLPEHGDDVVIEQVVYNFGKGTLGIPREYEEVGRFEKSYLTKYVPEAKVVTGHTGYTFYIRNAVVTVRYSADDLYPFDIVDGFVNNESLVLDMVIDGGQRILFTDEVFVPGSRALVNMYGEDLASDVIQLSHHGHYGATEELYQCIWPASTDYSDKNRFALWPIGNEEQRRDRLALAENLWILRRIAEDVGIKWKTEWDTYIASVKTSTAYKNDASRFKAIGKYLTDSSRLGYLNGPLWSKIYSMCDMMFKYGNITDRVGSNETNYVPASGVLGTWETIELYTK